MKVAIPASLDEAIDKLGSLGKLLTATEWERAAIVATFVEGSDKFGGRKPLNSERLSPAEFAAKGIAGLKSDNTVRRYHDAWVKEAGLRRPRPGEHVSLPTIPFPASSKTDDTEPGAQKVKDIQNNSNAAARALSDDAFVAKVVEKLDDDTLEKVADAVAQRDPLASYRAANKATEDTRKDLTRRRKAVDARRDVEESTPAPLTPMALGDFALVHYPAFKALVERIQANGMNSEAAGIMLMFCDQIDGLTRVVRAQLSGELNPMSQDEFDAAIGAILTGGAS